MAYDRQHLALRWGYTVAGTEEIANTGMNLSRTGYVAAGIDMDAIRPVIGVIGAAMLSHMVNLRTGTVFTWFTWSQLRTFRIAAVNTAGLEIGAAALFEDDTPATGANEGTGDPQQSVVCSLRSGQTTGGANYGKMYLPHCRFNTPNGQAIAAESTATAAVASFKTFVDAVVDDINEVAALPLEPYVMSFKDGQASKVVTQLGVGRVVDVQRRRRNKLEEGTQFLAWP